MKFDNKTMKVLGVIKGRAKSLSTVKSRSLLDLDQLENILKNLENESYVTSISGKGFFGKPNPSFTITSIGSKLIDEYVLELQNKWKEIIQIAATGDREKLESHISQNPDLIKTMLFFGIVNLPTLSRLNMGYLIETKSVCFTCKKELGKFSQKFAIKDCNKFNFKIPHGMKMNDKLCSDCFDNMKSIE